MNYKISISKDVPEFHIEANIENNASVDFERSGKDEKNVLDGVERIMLGDMSISKQIYTPNCVRLHLLITPQAGKGIISVRETLRHYLVDSTLSVMLNTKVKDKDETLAVAEGYKVIELKYKSSKAQIALELLAYSPDKYATLDKHSQAFTGKTVNEILEVVVKKRFGCPYSTANTLFLHYMMKNDKDSKEETRQYHRIPYAVQYNESTYDFMARLAKKHGEFLFFEEGKLHIGGQDDGSPVIPLSNEDIVNILFEDSTLQAKTVYVGTNHLGAKEEDLYKAFHPTALSGAKQMGVNVVNQECVSNDAYIDLKEVSGIVDDKTIDNKREEDEYLETPGTFELFNNNPYVLYNKDACIASNLLGGLSDILSAKNYIDMALVAGIKLKEATLDVYNDSKDINDGYLDGISKSVTYLNDKGKKKKKMILLSGARYTDGPYGKGKLKYQDPFAFLSYIAESSLQAKRDKIALELKEKFFNKDLKLGSHISLEGKVYIVTAMTVKKVSEDLTLFPSIFLEVIPYIPVTRDGDGGTIPYFELSDLKRESSTQVAIVVDTQDPYRLNRVRVRYPWQFVGTGDNGENNSIQSITYKLDGDDDRETLLEGATPWIRVATPAAKGGGGFIFTPEKFSEVLVNYENGNIERPYVECGVYRRTEDLYDAARNDESTSALSSCHGQKIIFKDESGGLPFVGGLVGPLVDFIFKKALPDGVEGMEALNGSTEITDRYGVNSIKLETGARNISIQSTMGDININALTGISIEAPSGDIEIKGKNVSILAGNNLSLVSGTNIKRPSQVSSTKLTIISTINDNMGLDFSLIRTIFEAIFKPVGGAMVIKSNRYLCLEAGRGEAKVNSYVKKNPLDKNNEEEESQIEPIKEPLLHFLRIFDNCKTAMDFVREKEIAYKTLYESATKGYEGCLNGLTTCLIDDKKTLVDNELKKLVKPEAVVSGDSFNRVHVKIEINYETDLKHPDDADKVTVLLRHVLDLENALNEYSEAKFDSKNKLAVEVGQIADPLLSVIKTRLFLGEVPELEKLYAPNSSEYAIVRQAIDGQIAAKRILLLAVIQLMQEKAARLAFNVETSVIQLALEETKTIKDILDKIVSVAPIRSGIANLKPTEKVEIVCKVKLKSAGALTEEQMSDINASWRFIVNNIFADEEMSLKEMLLEAIGGDGMKDDMPYFVGKEKQLDRSTLDDGRILFSDDRYITYSYDSHAKEFVTSDASFDNAITRSMKEVMNSLEEY